VGREHGPHISECTGSNGFVVRLVLTLMMFNLGLARMHAVHVELSVVSPSMSDCKAV